MSASNLAAVAASYLLGSIPWGLVLVKLVAGVDVRDVGSGNIGATNSARAGGRWLGIVVFVLDFLKGWAAVALVARIGEPNAWAPIACGVAAVLGHCFPIWLRFKGGKGVATLCGVVVAIGPLAFVAGGLVWLAVVAVTRYVGLASMLMCFAFAGAAWWLLGTHRTEIAAGLAALALLILVRHRSNMSRMLAGTEPKLFKKRASHG
jgi:glycerol-3-phosphate acyltransferase PlsY